jgi:catechol 2,3-dioxygenase-like lactoylglutathione lyase family enzyme
MNETWPEQLPIAQVRIARATSNLAPIQKFYCDGLGLSLLRQFQDHEGYSGIVLGLPGLAYQLEFTQGPAHGPLRLPDPDDLLVFYIPHRPTIGRLVVRLGALGYRAVVPANPYWEAHGVTIPDPDGWRIVLVESPGL